jgi:hypothetical protein
MMPYSSVRSYQTKEPAVFKFRAEEVRLVRKTVYNTEKGGLTLELRVNQCYFSMGKRSVKGRKEGKRGTHFFLK